MFVTQVIDNLVPDRPLVDRVISAIPETCNAYWLLTSRFGEGVKVIVLITLQSGVGKVAHGIIILCGGLEAF
ncbi:hypothetical protein D3C87_1854810 [compost metagenome]